jgi:hypothetical protein
LFGSLHVEIRWSEREEEFHKKNKKKKKEQKEKKKRKKNNKNEFLLPYPTKKKKNKGARTNLLFNCRSLMLKSSVMVSSCRVVCRFVSSC